MRDNIGTCGYNQSTSVNRVLIGAPPGLLWTPPDSAFRYVAVTTLHTLRTITVSLLLVQL